MSAAETAAGTNDGAATTTVNSPRRDSVLRGIIFNWGSLLVGIVVAIVLTPIMIRTLGQYYYGMWVLVMSISDQYGLLDIGMAPALSRFAGFFQGTEDRNGLDEIFCIAFLFTLMISVMICALSGGAAVLLPAFFHIAASDRSTFVRVFLLLGLTTAIAFPERMLAAYLRGIQRFDLFNAAATGVTVVRGVLFVIALRSGFGILTIALLTLGMGLVSFAVNYRMVRWADPALTIRFTNPDRKRLRELFGFSIYVFIGSMGSRLITRVDSIVIGRLLSVAMIAPFNIASRFNDYSAGLFGGIHGPVLSAMSKLDGASQPDELRALFIRSTRYTFLLSLLIASLLVFDGKALLTLWLGNTGLNVTLTYKLLVILTACYTSAHALLPSWIVIYARARHQLLAWLILAEGAANLGLSIYWGHRYGLVGIALGTAVPAIFDHLLIIPFYALSVIHLSLRKYLTSLIMPLLTGALFAALCALTAAQPRSIMIFGLQGLCQISVFALIAYGLAVTNDEKHFLWMRCKALFHTSGNY